MKRKDYLNRDALLVLVLGIGFDIITTIIGEGFGFQEGNPAGFFGIYVVNILVLLTVLFILNRKMIFYRFCSWLALFVGISRFLVGIINIITLIRFV